ncbi:SSI family serine proteinase inhibitor [Sphaerisporangium corydalis]|uniref:SSI family serine proteinase inhibitor n=1 Tax=Sphaerisporangium corydalis TaxID=1441875 RepID=A0ABV9EH92_9ACTN|nr:SSI family serine proteinase inhibitor [Sphaerisporangium corydalis]
MSSGVGTSGVAVDNTAQVLALTVRRGPKAFPPDRIVTLRCSPPSGSHPRPVFACRVLAVVGGDPTKLDLSPGANCPKIFAPVSVAALGTWNGNRIRVERTFGNACLLKAATGPVFDF